MLFECCARRGRGFAGLDHGLPTPSPPPTAARDRPRRKPWSSTPGGAQGPRPHTLGQRVLPAGPGRCPAPPSGSPCAEPVRPGLRARGRLTSSRSICCGCQGPTRPCARISSAGRRWSPCSPGHHQLRCIRFSPPVLAFVGPVRRRLRGTPGASRVRQVPAGCWPGQGSGMCVCRWGRLLFSLAGRSHASEGAPLPRRCRWRCLRMDT